MRKIINPFLNTENGKCFGCSPDNPQGLKMSFHEDGEYIYSHWTPNPHLTGFKNVLHGGIQTTLMDEIACWVVFVKLGTSGVTTSINAKFRGAVLTDQGNITLRAKLIKQKNKLATILTEILDKDGKVSAEAEIQYMIFPEAVAKRKFEYPGVEAFFNGEE